MVQFVWFFPVGIQLQNTSELYFQAVLHILQCVILKNSNATLILRSNFLLCSEHSQICLLYFLGCLIVRVKTKCGDYISAVLVHRFLNCFPSLCLNLASKPIFIESLLQFLLWCSVMPACIYKLYIEGSSARSISILTKSQCSLSINNNQ